ncbi:glycosyltransferase family 4 protein [Candidatus Pantoea soli]|uniref:Glycosyltransferase family 1 protein n=1 Tax=Candidatus Pantoea soli TaxID=3098669 RepID=A0A518XDX5_9GAMM|nr:glycosyltransferase family 4 protein [Pantoea soli]QDY42394.1 glycosyltransferase family 1 protein [Pantoea soli]
MRIIFFVNTAWYFNLHWIERVNKLVDDGHEVHLVTSLNDEKTRNAIEQQGIKCWHLDIDRFSLNLLSNLKVLFGFYALISQIKPDLIHTITIKPNIIGGMISRLKGVPQIISIVGLGRAFQDDGKLKKIGAILYKAVLYKNEKVRMIFEHNADKEFFQRLSSIKNNDLYVINGAGVNTDKFFYKPEVVGKETKILFASRLLKSKGLEIVVDSIRELKKEGVNVELMVAGIVDNDDPDHIPLNQLYEWQREKLINWLGTRDDINLLLQECNIMILPTKYAEGIPRIILEACSVGRACIVGNMPGCQSIITNGVNGMILESHNTDDLCMKIKYLHDNPEVRREFGINSAKKIREFFSTEIVVNETLKVYQSVILDKKYN